MKPLPLGIGRPSCAGKSELPWRLAAALPARVLPLDRCYRDLTWLSLEERALEP